jgi:hypothetical protein
MFRAFWTWAKAAVVPDRQGPLLEERTFLKLALDRFPELAEEEPNIEIGIHVAMDALAHFTLRAVRDLQRRRPSPSLAGPECWCR